MSEARSLTLVRAASPSALERARDQQSSATNWAKAALTEALANTNAASQALAEVATLEALSPFMRDRVRRLAEQIQTDLQGIDAMGARVKP